MAAGFTITGLLDGASRTRGRYPVSEIAVADIADHPANAAYSMDPAGIAELAESIREDGLTDLPLVRKVGDGSWQMVSGHRRKAAYALLAKDDPAYERMPCRVIEGIDDERAVTLLHAANYFTRALTVTERAAATEALRGDAVRLRSEDPSLSGMRVDDVKAAIIERQTGRKVSGKTIAREERLARRIAEDLSPEWAADADWIGYTDVDSSGRGAGDGRAVYEGPQAPEAFHRRVQEADSRPLQRRQAQARDHGRVRPRQEHRGEVDQVDKRDRLAARRVQPHARAEPDPGARAREPQAPDGGRRLKTSGADIRSKVRAIAANEGRYPISAQCRLLGVARSTYYSMRSRADRPAAPDPAAPAVVAAHAASKGRYGSRKIKASLERSGVTVSRRRVCRIMRENGLVSAYGRKRFKVHPGAVNEADVPNVVARGFGGRAPRTHICSDLTYVRVGASWNYVCLLVDLYNREIVGHSAGPRKDARLVKSAFATLSFPISDIEVFHTDRGSEFDNAEIDLMLEAFGIERSLSAKGCPYDNAVDESTNRILKAELVHRETFGTTRELRAKLSDYVHWYNNFRIHSTLGYMSPVEFREAGLSLPESSK